MVSFPCGFRETNPRKSARIHKSQRSVLVEPRFAASPRTGQSVFRSPSGQLLVGNGENPPLKQLKRPEQPRNHWELTQNKQSCVLNSGIRQNPSISRQKKSTVSQVSSPPKKRPGPDLKHKKGHTRLVVCFFVCLLACLFVCLIVFLHLLPSSLVDCFLFLRLLPSSLGVCLLVFFASVGLIACCFFVDLLFFRYGSCFFRISCPHRSLLG